MHREASGGYRSEVVHRREGRLGRECSRQAAHAHVSDAVLSSGRATQPRGVVLAHTAHKHGRAQLGRVAHRQHVHRRSLQVTGHVVVRMAGNVAGQVDGRTARGEQARQLGAHFLAALLLKTG
eukprot:5533892-Pleurochrysis_carterae.AAC.3